jgi:fluoride exporter
VLRWAVFTSVDAGRFAWPVLAVNVAGSLILGVQLAEEWSHPRARLVLHVAGGIDFCGSLTTFSTFSVEEVTLSKDGDVRIAGDQ